MLNDDPGTGLPWWGYVLSLLGVGLATAGAMIGLLRPALLVSPHAEISDAVRIYAGYMAARNLAIAVTLAVLGIARARRFLALMFIFMGLVQILDAVMDIWEKRWPVVPGVFLLGMIFMVGGYKLFRPGAMDRPNSAAH